MNANNERDPRYQAIPDTHGHAKGEHKLFTEERPLPLTARMLFLWFYHACKRGHPRFLMVADHMNYLTFEDPAAVNLVRRALKLAQAGDLYGAAETATVEVGHAAVVSEGLRRGMRYSIGAEVDNDPRSRPDAQNIVDAMRPDGIIRSVHFIPVTHPVHGENWLWPFDNPEFADAIEFVGVERLWETYITTLVDAIERLPGHIIGHFFVPAVFGSWPDDDKLSEYEDRVLAAAGARDMAIEFNTRFLYRDHSAEEKQRYLAANKRLLRKAKERGVQIAVGSDAHSPKDQGNQFHTVLAVLDELEINEIVFPLGGTLRRVALRVVREPEPEPVPVAEPAQPAVLEPAVAEPLVHKPVRKPRPAVKRAPPVETVEFVEVVPAGAVEPVQIAADDARAVPAAEVHDAVVVQDEAVVAPSEQPVKTAAARKRPEPEPPVVKPTPAVKPEPAVKAAPVAKAAPIVKATPVTKAVPVAKAAPAVKAAPRKTAPPKAKAALVAKPAAKTAAAVKPAARAAKPALKGKPVAKKAAPVKAVTKKTAAGKAVKKAAPRPAAKHAPAKKSAPVKKAAKKTAAARSVKKAVPAKKSTAKKAPAHRAPARKTTAAKKSAKKTAAKRR